MRDADLLSYRAPCWSVSGRLISIAGRGPEVHSACAAWSDNGRHLQALGMRLYGPKQALLSHEVQRNPGLIDVYRLSPVVYSVKIGPLGQELHRRHVLTDEQRRGIAATMRDLTLANRYGWQNVLRSSLAFLPGIRCLVTPSRDDVVERRRPPYCSQAYAYAVRRWYVDLIKNRPDHDVLPAELVVSAHLNYLFTLAPAVSADEAKHIAWYLRNEWQADEDLPRAWRAA